MLAETLLSLYQAWFLSPSHGDCLKLGHDTWLKVSAGLVNPKMLLWLQKRRPFGPLCPTLQLLDTFPTVSLCAAEDNVCCEYDTMGCIALSSHPAQLSPPMGTSQANQLLRTPVV